MRRLLLLPLLAGCAVTPIQESEGDFQRGMELRSVRPADAEALCRGACAKARRILETDAAPEIRLECWSILARTELEWGRSEEAERYLELGRGFFEHHDPVPVWPGDPLAIHVMKGDFFAHRARTTLESFGGRVRGSVEADAVVSDLQRGVEAYLAAEDRARGTSRSFVRLRMVRTLVEISRVWKVESALHDTVYIRAAHRSLTVANDRVTAEMERPGPYYDRFRDLRKEIDGNLWILRKIVIE